MDETKQVAAIVDVIREECRKQYKEQLDAFVERRMMKKAIAGALLDGFRDGFAAAERNILASNFLSVRAVE